MTYEQILVEQRGPIALVTLYRPAAMNAWTWQMSMEMADAFAKADADDAIRAIVVTGHGKMFCSGADLGGGGSTWAGDKSKTAIGSAEQAAAARSATKPYMLKTPIIAAINGAAVGAGLTMPMAWDLRVAADDAKLGFVFNRRGVIPDADLIWTIPRMIGFGPAMDVLLTGRIFLGKEARELGLVHRSVPREDVLETALEMARDIAANTGPVSVAITKRLMYQFLMEPDRTTALQTQRELFAWAGKQADAKEGVSAFLQKRPAQWKLSKTKDLPERMAK